MEADSVPIERPRKKWISPDLRIAIRIILCILLLWSIIDRLTKTRDSIETITPEEKLNPGYIEKIDVETHLMTHAQLSQLFSDSSPLLITWEKGQTGILNDASPLYFVLRLRNRGDQYAWGRIETHSEKWVRGSGIEGRRIPIQLLPPNMQDFQTYILATSWSTWVFEHKVQEKPYDITTEWFSLYTSAERDSNGK